MRRQPIVSGQFYPGRENELKQIIEGFISKEPSKMSAKAIILPHAGYVYSGRVAVTTVNKILPKKTLIILGPKHTSYGADFSLWPKDSWDTPFGPINIDENLAKSIMEKGDYITEDEMAHKFEHSIEVELPIFHYFFGEFTFVPIACQIANITMYRNVASQIYEALKNRKEDILIVASSDMTHYEPDPQARKKDSQAIESIINLDEEELVKKVRAKNISMCGIAPVAILISCVKKLGAKKAQVALYQTSGDTSGDYSSVVGYAGIIIS